MIDQHNQKKYMHQNNKDYHFYYQLILMKQLIMQKY